MKNDYNINFMIHSFFEHNAFAHNEDTLDNIIV